MIFLMVLNYILSHGVAENHFHLKGSSPTFHLSWQSMMNRVNNPRFKKIFDPRRIYYFNFMSCLRVFILLYPPALPEILSLNIIDLPLFALRLTMAFLTPVPLWYIALDQLRHRYP